MKKISTLMVLAMSSFVFPASIISCSNRIPEDIKLNTVIRSEIDSRIINWNEKTSYQIFSEYKDNIPKLKEFILSNINSFIDGETKLIKSIDNLDVSFMNPAKNTSNFIKLKITIFKEHWYKNNEIQKEDLIQEVLISNLKPIPSNLNPEGGQVNGLNVSSYKELISLLNLNNRTQLPLITNDTLNNNLQIYPDFKNLKLDIKDGNTIDNKLVLTLNGKYKEEIITNKDIEIIGFYKIQDKEVKFSSIKLNEKAWFDDLKPIENSENKEEINRISIEEWSKYLNNFNILSSNSDPIGTKEELISMGWKVNFKATHDTKQDKINFNNKDTNLTYENKKYNTKSKAWENIGKNTIINIYPIPSFTHLNYLTSNDVKVYLIDQTTPKIEEFKNYYPSYFHGIAKYAKKLNISHWNVNDFFTNDKINVIKDTYFKTNNISLSFDFDWILANDFNNTLSLSTVLSFDGSIENKYSKRFSFENKTKNIKDNKLINTKEKNKVLINVDSNLKSYIIRYLKSKHKDLVDQLFNSTSHETEIKTINHVDSKNLTLNTIDISKIVRYDNNPSFVESDWNNLKRKITPTLFNRDLSLSFDNSIEFNEQNELNFNSGLYYSSRNEAFYIEDIHYNIEDLVDIKLVKEPNYPNINISIDFKTEVTFLGEKKIYDSSLSMILLKSNWDSK